MSLLPRQIRFVDYYLDSLNQSEAYRKAYKVAKEHSYCTDKAVRLMKNPLVKALIESKKKEIANITKEDIHIRLEKLFKDTKKDTTKLKILELQSKLNNLLTTNEIQQTTNIIDYGKLVDSMKSKASNRATP